MIKGNLGCGSIQPEGWVNFDTQDFGQEHVGSTELFEDNYFDIIVAHCALQIIDYNDYIDFLKELKRVLKPGGILRVSLPDIERGFKALQENHIEWFPNGEANIHDRFSNWLTWYSTSNTLLTPDALNIRLIEAGFEDYLIHEVSFEETYFKDAQESVELDDRRGECYFMEVKK